MCLPHVREIFYGGAAGGGKSDWLLMEALQYVDIPHYRAKIFRLTLADADNEDSIMFRCREWLTDTDAKSEKNGQRWRFPSGATLSFGGLDKKDDHLKQQGAQFSFLGFDELTQFKSHQFEYLINSRLRKPGCKKHKDVRLGSCKYCRPYMHTNLFPLRIRCAANPGNRSHLYVKRRYDIGPIKGMKGPTGRQLYAGRCPDKPHIPAFVHDNPFLDVEDYIQQLGGMTDPVTREQLLSGDWGVTRDGRFKQIWCRRWRRTGKYLYVNGKSWRREECSEFVIIDSASTVESSPGTAEHKNKEASWTVVARFLVTPRKELCLMNVRRAQVEIPEIISMARAEMSGGPCAFVGMEHTIQSIHLFKAMQMSGLPMKAFKTKNKDKVARSTDAAVRMEAGQILLPEEGPEWLQTFEDELWTWTGHPDETDDQVDVLSYAAIHVTQEAGMSAIGGLPGVI